MIDRCTSGYLCPIQNGKFLMKGKEAEEEEEGEGGEEGGGKVRCGERDREGM